MVGKSALQGASQSSPDVSMQGAGNLDACSFDISLSEISA